MAYTFQSRGDVQTSIVQQYDPMVHQQNARSRNESPNAPPTNGYHNEDDSMNDDTVPVYTSEDERLWRDQELNRKIMDQVEENGITRPKGWKVSYHYNSTVEDMHFGKTHPMKPWRLTLTKHLVLGYGLQYSMDTFEAVAASREQVAAFHDPDYVEFLSKVSPHTFETLSKEPKFARVIPPKHENDVLDLGPYNLSTSPGADCPVFSDMSTYLFLYTGATMEAASKLITGQSDIAINWSGGLHHAHKSEASGFCYINDIVLAILEMLKRWARVLYIDIDVHHGDGVEEAFQRQPRVMTVSLHRYGSYDETGNKFFPGTGDISDIGLRGTQGEHFALNVPIPSGIDDRQYREVFQQVISRVIQNFKPSAIVLQCGADSLGGDRLGQFNLNIKAHGECVSYVKSFGLPLLLLGGGGYTARNVARAWCHETALTTENELSDDLPLDFLPRPEAFTGNKTHGDGKLFPTFGRAHSNECKDADFELMIKKIDVELRYVAMSPWVQMDTLPVKACMERAMDEVDEDMKSAKAERDRRRKERDPAGRGERR
ncbi:hypothetical protein AMS68_005025 [Peltaster fructicola]|uniref:Histone deacetylase n=1 Tax=Peltaster fructicola TaxID=286661 RepID=A0A6H0XY41_9PEZI|nr:hypothetical protein AMS68_005025 [Peltaster fructicola]